MRRRQRTGVAAAPLPPSPAFGANGYANFNEDAKMKKNNFFLNSTGCSSLTTGAIGPIFCPVVALKISYHSKKKIEN